MLIETYILTYNEEKIMPYLMRHYSKFSQVILMDGFSNDNTRQIALSYGANIIDVDTNNQVNDHVYTHVKNNYWKGSKADWVIICDADEFIYHPDLIGVLETTKCTIIEGRMYNMISENFPSGPGQIYDEIKTGFVYEYGTKKNVFRPGEIKEMNYSPGCHYANPVGNVIIGDEGVKTLHYRYLSKEFVVNKQLNTISRMSEVNKQMGWGRHIMISQEEMEKYFDEKLNIAEKVI
jgi:glycosyltransferase involved in cell wall biosynthesis